MCSSSSNEEKDFLSSYNPNDFDRPSVAADIVVLTIRDSKRLGLLLVERGEHPYKGSLALPGVFVRMEESVDAAAKRALNEETGLKDIPLVQVGTFGEVGRDPRMRVISVAYMAFVPSGRLDKCRPGEKECKVGVYEINDTLYKKLAFDHADIVRTALTRLRNRLDYTDEALDFVEDQEAFTIRELRQIYEAVKGDRIDAGNFHRMFKKKFISGGMAEATGQKERKSIYKTELYRRIK